MNYKRVCQYFVAYKGHDLHQSALKKSLALLFTSFDYQIKSFEDDENVMFYKMVLDLCQDNSDPVGYLGLGAVSGYDKKEMLDAVNEYGYGIENDDICHLIISRLYSDCEIKMFKKLADAHFCTVICDENKNLIAGVTVPNNEYTHLYYGYTSPNNEVVFSNSEELLENLGCHDIKEMPENTYMKDGKIYNFDGIELDVDNQQLIKNTKENADSLILGLNKLLVQVTNEAVKERIGQNIDECLSSDDSKKRIEDYIDKELDSETQKQVLNLIKEAIENNDVENIIDSGLKDIFEKKYNKYINEIQLPVVNIIKLNDIELGQTAGGFYHQKFEEILSQVQLEEPVMLIGPAGSGKNVTVKQVADALGLHMYYTNNASNEFKLTGFIDAGGNYRETEFYKAFKNGGLFNLDEVDASDPNALIVINSALANGYMAFPHETIDRHKDFRIVAAANTWGKGADMQYVGRNILDGATLDRFDNIYLDYDRNLEKNLFPDEEILEFMWSFRDAVEKSKVHHIVSTRGIGKVYKKSVNNFPVEQILRTNVVRNLGQDDLNTIIGNMENIHGDNKYFDGVKSLRLTK